MLGGSAISVMQHQPHVPPSKVVRLESYQSTTTRSTADSSYCHEDDGNDHRSTDDGGVGGGGIMGRRRRQAHSNSGSSPSRKSTRQPQPPPPPPGFKNVGNTCYANAALQCLFSTALTRALLRPKDTKILRRFSSNHHLLLMDSESVDSAAGGGEEDGNPEEERDEAPSSAKEDSKTISSSSPEKADTYPSWRKISCPNRHREMSELSKWITKELTDLCQRHQLRNKGGRDGRDGKRTGGHGFGSKSSSYSFFPDFLSSSGHGNGDVVDPGNVTRHVKKLSTCLTWGRQEDAHEFLRALLSALIMDGFNKELSSLFDGLLESAVTCQTCGHSSLTRDRYMDLSLEINSDEIHTLTDALEHFTRTELLGEDNLVQCDGCDERRQVSKGLRLATAPSILVCHLKRFEYDPYGRARRVNKKLTFPTRLDLREYMSLANKSTPPTYELVAIVVHQGKSCNSGHYLAYVRGAGPPGAERKWYRISDSTVQEVEASVVLEREAYILLYEVEGMRNHGVLERSTSGISRSSVGTALSRASGGQQRQQPGGGNRQSKSSTGKKEADVSIASILNLMHLCGATEAWEGVCGLGHHQYDDRGSLASSEQVVHTKVQHFQAATVASSSTTPDPLIGLDVVSGSKDRSDKNLTRDGAEGGRKDGKDKSLGDQDATAGNPSNDDVHNQEVASNGGTLVDKNEGETGTGTGDSQVVEEQGNAGAADDASTDGESSIPSRAPAPLRMRRVASSSNLNERGEDAARAYRGRLPSAEAGGVGNGDSVTNHTKPKRSRSSVSRFKRLSSSPLRSRRGSGGDRASSGGYVKSKSPHKSRRNANLPPKPRPTKNHV